MARVHKKAEDRKNEIEEVKREESVSKPKIFGQDVEPRFQGGKEIPVKEPTGAVPPSYR